MHLIVTASPQAAEVQKSPSFRRSEILGPFSSSKVLLHRDRLDLLLQGELPPPVTVEVDLSDGFCNHSCPHCFFASPQKSTPQHFPLERARSLGRELADMGVKAIEFPGGGEPTTHPHFGEIVREFGASQLPMGLVTNGQLYERVADVIDLFRWVRVSLDAGTAEMYRRMHGVDRFDQILRGIRRLAAASSTPIGVAFLVTPDNWRTAPDAIDALGDSGISYLQFRPASKVAWQEHLDLARDAEALTQSARDSSRGFTVDISSHKWARLREGRRFSTCDTSPLVGIVKASGDVPFCCLRRDEGPFFGNVLTHSFGEVWSSTGRREAWSGADHSMCPIPCKHDAYNEAFHALRQDDLHTPFL